MLFRSSQGKTDSSVFWGGCEIVTGVRAIVLSDLRSDGDRAVRGCDNLKQSSNVDS